MVLGGKRERMLVSCAASAAADMEAAEGGALAVVASAAAGGRPGVAGGGREPVGLPCPRCESVDTKFCYYNNYNLSQPRHFCKGCRRYWTRGGALRNVPVGGGTRKATVATTRRKRTGTGSGTPPAPTPTPTPLMAALPALTVSGTHGALLRQYGVLPFPATSLASPLAAVDPDRRLLDLGGSFSSRIAAADPDRRLLDLGGSFSALIAAAPPPDAVGAHHFSAGFLVGGLAAPALAHSQAQAAAALPPPPPLPPQQVSQALPEGLIWGGMGWPDLSI